MPTPPSPNPEATPSAIDVARGLLGRLNAEHAGDDDVPAQAERVADVAGASLTCNRDVAAGWWSVEIEAAAGPRRCEAKLTRAGHGRWRLWLGSGVYEGVQLLLACRLAVEFVEALRTAAGAVDALARGFAARTESHVALEDGRLTVTAADGRRCRGLVTAGADGPATLFLLDGDAWAGGASPAVRAGELEGRRDS